MTDQAKRILVTGAAGFAGGIVARVLRRAGFDVTGTIHRQEADDQPRQCVEKQRHCSADKGPYSQVHCLPSGHILL